MFMGKILKLNIMKKNLLLCLFVTVGLSVFAQKPVAEFTETKYDFGTIKEDGGKVTHDFEVTNTGDAPLIFTQIQASCGCTTPKWSKKPIAPGEKGSVTVTYNPMNRPGPFTKSITVTNNSEKQKIVLIIKGEVTPKAKPEVSNTTQPSSTEMNTQKNIEKKSDKKSDKKEKKSKKAKGSKKDKKNNKTNSK